MKVYIAEGKKESYENYSQKLYAYKDEGFTSLMPIFDENDLASKEEYAAYRQKEHQKFVESFRKAKSRRGNTASRGSSGEVEEVDATTDEFIADDYFASLLNRSREIEVDGDIYRYTEEGVFFTDEDNYENMLQVIESPDFNPQVPLGVVTDIGGGVKGFVMKCVPGDDCPEPPTPPIPPTPPTPPTGPTRDQIRDGLRVCGWQPNIFSIFGPGADCSDYFESDKRVRTKTWSHNYLLFASTGTKVESQNRFARVWWAERIDELELGYTLTSFIYDPKIKWPSSPNPGSDYTYELNGSIYNQNGLYIAPSAAYAPRSLFKDFPVSDASKKTISIYLTRPLNLLVGSSNPVSLDAKVVNDYFKLITKNVYKKIEDSFGNLNFTNETAVVVYPGYNNDGTIHFTYLNYNEVNRNDNKIVITYDWNTAVVGFTTNPTPTIGAAPVYSAPKSYKKFQSICYGMGRRGNTWKGSKIILIQDK